ncbi:MAG TPA: type II secretion system protein [Candidatus Paceibacterota bacterium]|nr:type II secretion system protein [Candidatus Paceibacterota bacterium]
MRRGFTLLEVMLVTALIGLVAGSGFLTVRTFRARDAGASASRLIQQALIRARTSAVAMRTDDSWGVSVAGDGATVFKGESFASRDDAYDEVFDFSAGVLVSGSSEFVFAKHTGVPASSGIVTVTYDDETYSVQVNDVGTIVYGP